MHFICLCPTYGRPSKPANALALFLAQDLRDEDTAEMIIFDDAGQIAPQSHPGKRSWQVLTADAWIPLTRKYNVLLERLGGIRDDATYVVWDDDDVYLPHHLEAIGTVMATQQAHWAHPSLVYSTYDDRSPPLIPEKAPPRMEKANGRFHGALAVRGLVLQDRGGWPDTDLATYDQQMLAALQTYHRADPVYWRGGKPDPSYCYRWQDANCWHASGSIDRTGQYLRPQITEAGTVDALIPRFDRSTLQILDWLVYDSGR